MSQNANYRYYGFIAVAVIGAVVGIGLLGSFAFSFGTVGEDSVAVETHWGESTGTVYQNGQYWKGNPVLFQGWSHGSDHLTVEPVTMTQQVNGLSADGQDVTATVSVTYQLNAEQAESFYADTDSSGPFQNTGIWEDRVGKPAIKSAVQDGSSSVSTVAMLEALTNEGGDDVQDVQNVETLRVALEEEVESQLREENEKLSPEVEIVEVRVEEVKLSDQLDNALEEIATERAEAERQVIDAEADAQAQRERAQGQADAFNTKKEAYGGSTEALQAEWIEAINEDEGTVVIDAEAAPILDLNEMEKQQSTTSTSD